MTMIRIRKQHAGDAAGRTDGKAWSYDWPQDGAVLEIPYAAAVEVLAIPHGGFAVAEPEDEPETGAEPEGGTEHDETAIEEPAPEAPLSEAPPARAAKKTAAKKSAAPVEE